MLRVIGALFGVLAITACTPLGTPTRSVALGQGDVVAATPAGYCIDGASSQISRDFAIVAPCATLDASLPGPDLVGFATIQVGPAGSGSIVADEVALRDYLITQDGARLLSQTGNAGDIDILSTQAFNSQVMIHFTDAGQPPLPGLQREEWRAFKDVSGRLVTIGVRGLAAAPLQEGPGATLLKLMVAGVQPANTVSEDPPADI